ncbi:hypothetical protein FB446DRAFT_844027 [Lentinula raphanica]|nr:hypothetical protein FB446DRAFT_844027 [Lentinula raphanica]
MSTSGWPYSNRCRRSLRIMPSRSVSSLVSSRVFPVLLLAMCLLSMSVIAGTTTDQVAKDQVKHYLPDFRSGPKNFHLEVVLQKYTSYLGDANSVSLRIGKDIYNSTKIGTRWKNKPKEIKLGHFHFVNEIQGNYDIEAARRSALQWPVLGDMVHWKFVNDMIMYLIFCDAADESTLENWRNAMPKSLLPLLAAAYFDQKNLITLVLYRTQAPRTDRRARPTAQVSLRIGDKLLALPERQKSIDNLNPEFIPFGRIKEGITVDFDALRIHAAKHTSFLDDGTQKGSKWLSDLKSKTTEWEENEPAKKGPKARQDHFREWYFIDGIMEGLWDQKAIEFPKSDWVDLRNKRMDIFINFINRNVREQMKKRKHQEISQS